MKTGNNHKETAIDKKKRSLDATNTGIKQSHLNTTADRSKWKRKPLPLKNRMSEQEP
ncbi:MAG TPA: hypothetical protein ACQGQH_06765 [Xylella sp.]